MSQTERFRSRCESKMERFAGLQSCCPQQRLQNCALTCPLLIVALTLVDGFPLTEVRAAGILPKTPLVLQHFRDYVGPAEQGTDGELVIGHVPHAPVQPERNPGRQTCMPCLAIIKLCLPRKRH
jgi:hypothetical protein